jgi:hypothetical protein
MARSAAKDEHDQRPRERHPLWLRTRRGGCEARSRAALSENRAPPQSDSSPDAVLQSD